jgi:hypothetical protein
MMNTTGHSHGLLHPLNRWIYDALIAVALSPLFPAKAVSAATVRNWVGSAIAGSGNRTDAPSCITDAPVPGDTLNFMETGFYACNLRS